jgi:hypothetical protein
LAITPIYSTIHNPNSPTADTVHPNAPTAVEQIREACLENGWELSPDEQCMLGISSALGLALTQTECGFWKHLYFVNYIEKREE